jgi:tRNA uracil 4-sulfurtransferase
MYKTLLINVDEMWLKGRNRPYYYKVMRRHVKEIAKILGHKKFTVKNENQRLVLRCEESIEERLIERLQTMPGIFTLQPARECGLEVEDIMRVALEEYNAMAEEGASFKVYVQRVNKSFPILSTDFSQQVAHHVLSQAPVKMKVDLKNHDLDLQVKITDRVAFISGRKLKGVGGLPIGTSGHAITMLSGGFDSPVASFLMAKRGVHQTFIFFHAHPYVGDEVKEKIKELTQRLVYYQQKCLLYVVPFGQVQDVLARHCQEEYRTLLFRHYMLKISEALAVTDRADAIITGDSLSQVSSQTIGNIGLLERSVDLPIFRPVIGLNKKEIIQISREIKTYPISERPHDDACALFAPKNPILRPNRFIWDNTLSAIPESETLIKDALEKAECFSLSPFGDIFQSAVLSQ